MQTYDVLLRWQSFAIHPNEQTKGFYAVVGLYTSMEAAQTHAQREAVESVLWAYGDGEAAAYRVVGAHLLHPEPSHKIVAAKLIH